MVCRILNEKARQKLNKPGHSPPICGILFSVAKPTKTKVYRAFRRFPALNESSVRDLPLVKQN